MQRPGYVPMVPFMPAEPMLFHAYVPYQIDVEEFSLADAVKNGTLFKALHSPFVGNVRGDEPIC